MHECFYSLLDLVIQPSVYETNINELLKNDWEETNVQKTFFVNPSEFISNLSNCVSSKFEKVAEEEEQTQALFSYEFCWEAIKLTQGLFTI